LFGIDTILVVDDEPVAREAMVRLLEGSGRRVFDTFNGSDALELIEQHPEISLLLSDIRMAGISGIELANEARRRRPALHIVLTSAYTIDPPAEFPFLQKPWRAKELAKILVSWREPPNTETK
jgi:CheY-like chemotaxis protein